MLTVAPKQPKQGAFRFPAKQGTSRYKRAERMVERGQAEDVTEALSTIYGKEFEQRNQKAKAKGFKSYGQVRYYKEHRHELMDKLLGGDLEDEDEAVSDLWRLFRALGETP